ncbi:CAF17-like 4Fe-4S cluster assembly/insertion protein YgfZ [Acidovorax sp. RAC01]|uniref:CAF17-like 4Fe-4S cluster assembly/insertion protein YgfZ n=1 Tax=Acidovorax sp. RAC01 TaxID=1842533 RepID=UPI00083E8C33|nr:folate-binding protein YgfZ [Acidovorax sp. RAC01]AOG21868.1 aminomethyltransferase folate-binding domain protein [Acidovorax sp. RAC01]
MTYSLNGVAPLSHLGVIRAEGEDAAKFLHGQLTQDFALLGMNEARLAAFLSAKGRMQATFIGFKRSATEVLLLCSADVLPATLKRLSMFVLRSKVKLTDATAEYALYGLAGDTAGLADLSTTPWSKADEGTASVVRLYPADGQPRALWAGPAGATAPAGADLDPAVWLWSEVRSGIATLTTPLFEAFVPQMLNYESVGGVNFKKGCYPGQEVVARSQFRGTLKRRAYLAHAAAGSVAVGAEVFSASDLEQPCGTVVQVADAPQGGVDLIVSMQISAADGPLQVGAPEGVPLTLLPLPYPLLDDI